MLGTDWPVVVCKNYTNECFNLFKSAYLCRKMDKSVKEKLRIENNNKIFLWNMWSLKSMSNIVYVFVIANEIHNTNNNNNSSNIKLTVTLNTSGQTPPWVSVLTVGPSRVNDSKSSLSQQTSGIWKKGLRCLFNSINLSELCAIRAPKTFIRMGREEQIQLKLTVFNTENDLADKKAN